MGWTRVFRLNWQCKGIVDGQAGGTLISHDFLGGVP